MLEFYNIKHRLFIWPTYPPGSNTLRWVIYLGKNNCPTVLAIIAALLCRIAGLDVINNYVKKKVYFMPYLYSSPTPRTPLSVEVKKCGMAFLKNSAIHVILCKFYESIHDPQKCNLILSHFLCYNSYVQQRYIYIYTLYISLLYICT